jgi:PAS domain S-box-containing protein
MDAMANHGDLQAVEPGRAIPTAGVAGMAYHCLNDSEWTMLWVSEGCRELTGFEPADIVGNRTTSYAQLIYPEDRLEVSLEVQTALEDGRPFQLRYRVRRADGELVWVWEQGHGVVSRQGQLLYIEGLITCNRR